MQMGCNLLPVSGDFMKILIAGVLKDTKNYEKALRDCQVLYETTLHPKDITSYSGLLLPGGEDIHPSYFGQSDKGSKGIDRKLDRAQFALLDAFVRMGRPVFGICRGMQLINVYFGGDIVQHLVTYRTHQYQGEDQVHLVQNMPHSILWKLYGDSCLVNSAHHQGCGRIGSGLKVTQLAPDKVVEAIEHKDKPILGVQWHPERIHKLQAYPNLADGFVLLRYFLELL